MPPSPSALPTRDPRRFEFVDALRGWAFLLVLAVHCRNQVSALPPVLRQFLESGSRGVQLFFLVSAFTLFHSCAERSGREARPTLNFFVRRFFRIAPLFWLAAILYLVLDGWGPNYWAHEGKSALDVALVFAFLHGWKVNAINCLIPGGWSIGVEMSFYLVVPWLCLRVRTLRPALWLALGSLVAGSVLSESLLRAMRPHYPAEWQMIPEEYVRAWFPAQAHVFALGMVLYFVLKTSPSGDRRLSGWLLATTLYLGVALPFNRFNVLPVTVPYGVTFVLLAWSLALHPWGLLVNPVTRLAGRLSYSCYINHFLVLFFLTWAERTGRLALPGQDSPMLRWGTLYGAGLAGTLLLSEVTYRAIELPFIELGRRIIARWEHARKAQAGENW